MRTVVLGLALLASTLLVAGPAQAAPRDDEARPKDISRLQEELQNLDETLAGIEMPAARAERFHQRAEEVREDAIYLKVKMRKHQKAGGVGTGVSYDEVIELRQAVLDLREDIERQAPARADREMRLPEGTTFRVRLEEALSSGTARPEDRFEASVYRPVRVTNNPSAGVAIPAGARIRGIVKDVRAAERPAREGQLTIEFDSLYLDRARLDLRSEVTAVTASDEDRVDAKEKAGIGAVLGSVLGGILGGKKGAVIGAVLGGGGAVVGTKGNEVELPAGTIVTVRLKKAVDIPRGANTRRDRDRDDDEGRDRRDRDREREN